MTDAGIGSLVSGRWPDYTELKTSGKIGKWLNETSCNCTLSTFYISWINLQNSWATVLSSSSKPLMWEYLKRICISRRTTREVALTSNQPYRKSNKRMKHEWVHRIAMNFHRAPHRQSQSILHDPARIWQSRCNCYQCEEIEYFPIYWRIMERLFPHLTWPQVIDIENSGYTY